MSLGGSFANAALQVSGFAAFREFLQDLLGLLNEAEGDVWVGSAARHATFVELGTKPHETQAQQEGFIRRITEWAHRQGINDEEIIGAIINEIQQEGTEKGGEPTPFFRSAVKSVVRAHDALFLVDESPTDYVIAVNPLALEEDEDVEDLAGLVQEKARRNAPEDQGILKESIVIGESRDEMVEKSRQIDPQEPFQG